MYLPKLLSTCPEETKVFSEKLIWFFNYFRTLSGKVFPFLSKKVQQGCRNWILRVYRNSLKEKFSWRMSSVSFLFLRHWAKNFWLFVNCFAMGLSKVFSKCPQEHFDEKYFLKFYLSIHFFCGIWQEKIRSSGKIFSAGLIKLPFTSL